MKRITFALLATASLGALALIAGGLDRGAQPMRSAPVALLSSPPTLPNGMFDNGFETPPCVVPGLTRLTRSSIGYQLGHPARPVTDVTEFANLWGHFNNTDAAHPWPGIGGSEPTLLQFTRHSFVSVHFRTGSSTHPLGNFFFPSNFPGPNIDMAISRTCGDFNPQAAACKSVDVASADNPLVFWNFQGNRCPLQANTDYFVNIRLHDPLSTRECIAGSTICPITTINYANP